MVFQFWGLICQNKAQNKASKIVFLIVYNISINQCTCNMNTHKWRKEVIPVYELDINHK